MALSRSESSGSERRRPHEGGESRPDLLRSQSAKMSVRPHRIVPELKFVQRKLDLFCIEKYAAAEHLELQFPSANNPLVGSE